MEKDEIICISSGDEVEPEKEKGKDLPEVAKPSNKCIIENDLGSNSKENTSSQKRKSSESNDFKPSVPNLIVNKKIKMSTVENVLIAMNSMSSYLEEGEKLADKPRLVVKEKKSLPLVEQDTFPQFISLCLQKDHSEDMKIIVNKLKRRYEQLQPAQAMSESFISFLNEKRNAISISTKKLYVHISDVMNEMKRMSKKDKHSTLVDGTTDDAKKQLDVTSGETPKVCHDNDEYETENQKVSKEIRMLEKCMKKCEKRIADLEEEEVDFNEETDSSYMKVERYKRRMVELWHRYCKLTGENVDAGRPYLRPKHLSATHIVAVDQAITNFINSQISKNNKQPKIGASVNVLIFPDYADILECISKCNDSHNLGLNKKQQQSIAKRAFTEIGQHLQLVRRNDYWDTFSLFLENKDDDPALKNTELAEKLNQNRRIGEKKLAEVFEDFVKKQDLRKNGCSSSSESEDEESSSAEDEIKDENKDEDAISDEQDDSDTDAEVKSDDNVSRTVISEEKVKKKISSCNENSNLNKQDVRKKSTETAATPDTTMVANRKSGVIQSVNEDSKDNKVNKKSSAKLENRLKEDSNLIRESTIVQNKNAKSIGNNNVAVKATIENKTQTLENSSKKAPVEPRKEVLPIQSPVTVCSIAAKETEETVGVNVSEEVQSKTDCSSEEEKPLLRVRSFAKPPTTWKDECQGTDRSNEVVLSVLEKPRVITTSEKKGPSDKSAKTSGKLSKNVITIRGGNRTTTVLRLPIVRQNELGTNGQNLPGKQNELVVKLLNGNRVLPIIMQKPFPIQKVTVTNTDSTSK